MFKSAEEMRSRGFAPGEFLLDGKVHRFDRDGKKGKTAWYIGWLHHSSKGGEQIEIISYGDWRTGEKYEWSSKSRLSADDRAAVNRRAKEAAKAAEEERQLQRDHAAAVAKETWDLAQDSGSSPYLERKGITALYGARTQMGENYRVVLVPMVNSAGELRGLQRIFHTGKKYFLEGQQVKGLCHVIRGEGEEVFVTEGFATAVTVHAVTGRTVYVAFNASNLEAVAVLARKAHPGKPLVICGDDDRRVTKPDGTPWNPGREAAEAAAKKVSAVAAFPVFADPESQGTDFNDLAAEESPARVAEILCPRGGELAEPAMKVRVLGRDGGNYFLISSSNRMLTVVPTGSMTSPARLLSLAPIDYWRSAYGENKSGSPDWQLAASVLMDQGNSAGVFSPLKVRGRGVWLDAGRTVVHQGDRLLVDGEPCGLMDLETRYVYEEDCRVSFDLKDPMRLEEASAVQRACSLLPWRNREHAVLAAGWIALCRVSGALPWRPHVWFTGEAGSGKTTLRDVMLKPAAGDLGIPPASMSTESGIRQHCRNASLAVLFDEFEATGRHKSELVSAVLDLARMASSESDDVVLKGTPGGSALVFRSRGMYAMFSIRVALQDAADISRFAVMELQKGDVAQFASLRRALEPMDKRFWDRLAARSVRLLPKILSDYRLLHQAIAEKQGSRFGQQYGMLLAGFCTLTSDEPITIDVARQLAEVIGLQEEVDRTDGSTPLHALDILLDHRIAIDIGGSRLEKTVFQLIEARNRDALLPLGLDLDSTTLYIRTGEGGVAHSAYSKSETWTRGWADQLSRIDGAKRTKHRFGSRYALYHSIAVPLSRVIS